LGEARGDPRTALAAPTSIVLTAGLARKYFGDEDPIGQTLIADGMTPYRENERQVFLHAGAQGVALFKKTDGSPVPAGGDMNHLALKVAGGTYESLKSELEAHGVSVSGRPATITASISGP
jgi:hypothetical protein